MNGKSLLLAFLVLFGAIAGLSEFVDVFTLRNAPVIDFNRIDSAPPATNAVAQNDRPPLRFAVASVFVPHDSVRFYRTIADYLTQRLQRPVIIVQKQSYAELTLLLDRREADFAFISPGEYASYREAGHNDVELSLLQERNGQTTYRSLLVVAQSSDIRTLDDLRGRTFAFADPMSFSGYLGALYLFQQASGMRFDPAAYFSRYMFTYNHNKSLRAVAEHVVDGAAVDSTAYDDAARRDPALTAAVRILAESPPVGTGSLVLRHSLDSASKDSLRSAFLAMADDPLAAEALHGLLISRFVPAPPTAYDTIRSMLRELRTAQ